MTKVRDGFRAPPAPDEPSNGTVLVVDDDAHLTALYASWLDPYYDTREATTGREALDRVDNDVDVVLLDRRMPGLSGDEVLADLREDGLQCSVIMVTGVRPDIDIIEMEFDDYLVKPVGRGTLLDTVQTLLTRDSYDDQVKASYALASKKAALETAMNQSELEASEEYHDLVEELDRVNSTLQSTLDELVESGHRAIVFRDVLQDDELIPESEGST